MSKVWRFDGTVTCEVTLWITGETQQEAEDKFSASAAEDLVAGTSIKHVTPLKETAVINTIRESTEDNP